MLNAKRVTLFDNFPITFKVVPAIISTGQIYFYS